MLQFGLNMRAFCSEGFSKAELCSVSSCQPLLAPVQMLIQTALSAHLTAWKHFTAILEKKTSWGKGNGGREGASCSASSIAGSIEGSECPWSAGDRRASHGWSWLSLLPLCFMW